MSAAGWKVIFESLVAKKNGDPVCTEAIRITSTSSDKQVDEQVRSTFCQGGKVTYKSSAEGRTSTAETVLLADMLYSLQHVNATPSDHLSPDSQRRQCTLYVRIDTNLRAQQTQQQRGKGAKQGRIQAAGKPSSAGLNDERLLSNDAQAKMRSCAAAFMQREIDEPHAYLAWEDQPRWARDVCTAVVTLLAEEDNTTSSVGVGKLKT